MNDSHTCACGCGRRTNTGLDGTPRKYLRGHNRRGVGKGWIEHGYRYICVDGVRIAEHRHIVGQREGRKLTSDEVIHHADGNPLNNDPKNLVVLSRSEHQRLHASSSRRMWTPEETERATSLREAGMKIWEVALVLGRPFSTTARHLAEISKESRLARAAAWGC